MDISGAPRGSISSPLTAARHLLMRIGMQMIAIVLLSFGLLLASDASAAEAVGAKRGSGTSHMGYRSSAGKCNITREKGAANNEGFLEKFVLAARKKEGKESGNLCLRGVRESAQTASGMTPSATWGVESAKDSAACFQQMGFEKIDCPNMKDTPKCGTVFIYDGGLHGHIEVYAGKNKQGQNMYCSDYCGKRRRDEVSPQGRPIQSCWFPKAGSKQIEGCPAPTEKK